MKVFDVVLGTAIFLFGVLVGFLVLKTLDINHLVIDRTFVFMVMTPCVIVGVGVQRIFKKRPAARS